MNIRLFKTLVRLVPATWLRNMEDHKEADEQKLNSFQFQCLRPILRFRATESDKQRVNGISCEIRRQRRHWLGHVFRREGVNNCFFSIGVDTNEAKEGGAGEGGRRPCGEKSGRGTGGKAGAWRRGWHRMELIGQEPVVRSIANRMNLLVHFGIYEHD